MDPLIFMFVQYLVAFKPVKLFSECMFSNTETYFPSLIYCCLVNNKL